MKVLPSAVRHILITLGLVVGLIAAMGGTAVAATPVTAGTPTVAAGVTQPTWNNDDNDRGRDRDRHKNGDRDRDHKGSWNGGWRHRWWVVSSWQCRKGHGHVDWRHGRCWGGRYSGAHIRRW